MPAKRRGEGGSGPGAPAAARRAPEAFRRSRRTRADSGELAIQTRHRAGDGGQRLAALGGIRQGGEKHLRVGVQRTGEELLRRRLLDDLAGVHQRHLVRHLRDDAQVVRDQQHRHAALDLKIAQQVEDLLLDRHVERRGRLVGDDQVRLGGQRDGDHHPLLLPAGELERVVVDAPCRLGDADPRQPLDRLAAGGSARHRRVPLDHLDDLLADPHHRVQAGGRLLEDDAHPPAAHVAHARLRQLHHVDLADPDGTLGDTAVLRQQAQDRQRRHRLAAAGLADQGEGLAAPDRQRQVLDRAHQPMVGVEHRVKLLNGKHGNPGIEAIGSYGLMRSLSVRGLRRW